MKLEKVAIWASLPLTVVGLIASFLLAHFGVVFWILRSG
jgi:Ca2+-dependent lipid-binding protein